MSYEINTNIILVEKTTKMMDDIQRDSRL